VASVTQPLLQELLFQLYATMFWSVHEAKPYQLNPLLFEKKHATGGGALWQSSGHGFT